LERFGILDELKSLSVLPNAFIIRSYKGQELNRQPMLPYCENAYGAPYLHIHRADFHKVLVKCAESHGIKIVLNAHVNAVDFSAPSVTLATGETINCDLVVAADGLKSKCRELYLGHADPPHNTGDLAYRILVKASDMKKDPELAKLTEVPMINYWMGPGAHAVCYLLKGGELYNIVLICPDNLPEGVALQDADLQELRDIFATWDTRLQKLLELVQQTFKWKLQNSEEMDSWVHPEGRFVLLGDACHATLPYLAQGAAQAVEDGAVLGGLLGKVTAKDKDNLRPLLDSYERLRKARTTAVVKGSTALQNVFHMADGEAQQERDRVLLEDKPSEGFPNRWRDPVFQKFLFAYDGFKEAEREWDSVLRRQYESE
jgi:salicylate hydroxylase